MFERQEPPAARPTSSHTKMTEQSSGVMALLAKVVADLAKELAESSEEEELAQTSYETLLADSSAKKRSLAQEEIKRQAVKASKEELIVNKKADATSAKQFLAEHIASLQAAHTECDWLVQHFDGRQELRDQDIESLNNAKAVLSGADYSLVQVRTALRR